MLNSTREIDEKLIRIHYMHGQNTCQNVPMHSLQLVSWSSTGSRGRREGPKDEGDDTLVKQSRVKSYLLGGITVAWGCVAEGGYTLYKEDIVKY